MKIQLVGFELFYVETRTDMTVVTVDLTTALRKRLSVEINM